MASLLLRLWQLLLLVTIAIHSSVAKRSSSVTLSTDTEKLQDDHFVDKISKDAVFTGKSDRRKIILQNVENLKGRFQRHSDGAFTSVFVQLLRMALMRNRINKVLKPKRSSHEVHGIDREQLRDDDLVDTITGGAALKKRSAQRQRALHSTESLKERYSDGLFASEYNKLRKEAALQDQINKLLNTQMEGKKQRRNAEAF